MLSRNWETNSIYIHWLFEPLIAIFWLQISVFRRRIEIWVDGIVMSHFKTRLTSFGAHRVCNRKLQYNLELLLCWASDYCRHFIVGLGSHISQWSLAVPYQNCKRIWWTYRVPTVKCLWKSSLMLTLFRRITFNAAE